AARRANQGLPQAGPRPRRGAHRPPLHQAAARLVRSPGTQGAPMTRVGGALRLWAAAWLLAAGALAQAPPPGAPNATSPAPAGTAPQPPPDPQAFGTCTERVPEGKARPKLTESFPKRGLSGHAQV